MTRRPKCLKCGRRNRSLRWGRCSHCLKLHKLPVGTFPRPPTAAGVRP